MWKRLRESFKYEDTGQYRKSGFTLCPQCEENESLPKCGCCKENVVSEPTSRFCTVCLRRFEEIANANKDARYFD